MRWRCNTFIIDPPCLFTLGSLIAIVSRRIVVSQAPNPFGPAALAAAGFAVMPATRLEVKQFQLCFGVDTVDKPLGEGVDGRGTAIVVAEDHRLDNDDSGAVFGCDLHAGF